MRKSFFYFIVLVWFISFHGKNQAQTHRTKTEPAPSVLIITVDTLSTEYVTLYDPKEGVTRNIDRIAEHGFVFLNAYTHIPLTLPSHASLFTGLTPMGHGIHDNSGFRLKNQGITLAEWFHRQGFQTAAFVSAFVLDPRFGLSRGFDTYDSPPLPEQRSRITPFAIPHAERSAEETNQKVFAWLDSRDAHRPWFLWVHFYDPHSPYHPPEKYRTGKSPQELYRGEVRYTDEQVGLLLDQLEKKHWLKNTVIVLAGDHGESFGSHGENYHGLFVYNTTVKIPLFLRVPGLEQNTVRIKEPVAITDIFPTLCGILKRPCPKKLPGRDLWPGLVQKEVMPPSHEIYLESLYGYYHEQWAPVFGVIDGHMKFIDTPIAELYNLKEDPLEAYNLATKHSLEKYRNMLRRFMGGQLPQMEQEETPETIELLRSLGYVGGPAGKNLPSRFGPDKDPKAMVSLHNRIMETIKDRESRNYDDAIQGLKEVITSQPKMILPYKLIVLVYREKGDARNAILAAQAGLRIEPDDLELQSQLGQALVEAGLIDKARQVLEYYVQKAPKDATAWNYLGIAYTASGKYNRAEIALRKALVLDAHDSMIHTNLGNLYLQEKRYKEAEQSFKKALSIQKYTLSALNGLGMAQALLDRWDDALSNWRKALEIDPDFTPALFNLGMGLYEHGKPEEAKPLLRKYLDLMGSNISLEEKNKILSILGASNHS